MIKNYINSTIKLLKDYQKQTKEDLIMAEKHNQTRLIRFNKYKAATLEAQVKTLEELKKEDEALIMIITKELRDLNRDFTQIYQEIKEKGQ